MAHRPRDAFVVQGRVWGTRRVAMPHILDLRPRQQRADAMSSSNGGGGARQHQECQWRLAHCMHIRPQQHQQCSSRALALCPPSSTRPTIIIISSSSSLAASQNRAIPHQRLHLLSIYANSIGAAKPQLLPLVQRVKDALELLGLRR